MSHYYRFKPPFVSQGTEEHCWAAALESWLKCVVWTFGKKSGEWQGIGGDLDGTQWRRQVRSKDQLLQDYSDQTDVNGALKGGSLAPYRTIGLDFGMGMDFIGPAKLTLDYLNTRLRNFGHLYVTYFSNVMRHAVVVYGISATDGIAVMDPNPGVRFIHRKLDFFQTPERLKEPVSVGFPIKD